MSMFIEKNMLFPFYSRHFLNSSSLIPGHKKSDSENVYSSLKGLGAIDIRITVAKIQKICFAPHILSFITQRMA